jgi:hypothetical protein
MDPVLFEHIVNDILGNKSEEPSKKTPLSGASAPVDTSPNGRPNFSIGPGPKSSISGDSTFSEAT